MILKKFIKYFSFMLLFFSTFTILFQKSSYDLDEDDVSSLFFVCSPVANNVDSGSCSGVRISSKIFIGNILLLKSLRTFSLAPINNLMLFRKHFFQTVLHLYPYPLTLSIINIF